MRLLFIRHGEPDYEHDCLDENGRRELEALARIIPSLKIDHAYVSPLGRAQETAARALAGTGLKAETLPWLEEYTARIDSGLVVPGTGLPELQGAFHPYYNEDGSPRLRGVWDIYPAYYCSHPELRNAPEWKGSAIARHSDHVQTYERVAASFDAFLADHGYVRRDAPALQARLQAAQAPGMVPGAAPGGSFYFAERPNDETIAFFCHFAISCVLLSRLWSISPFIPLQSFCMAPSSVTEVVTEERQEGHAFFRALRIGDISHLNMAGVERSFFARFCELYSNTDERH